MMQIIAITTTSEMEKTERLIKSLKKYEWDFRIIFHPWDGFLGKIHYTYNFLKEYTKTISGDAMFIYSDAWDSLCFGSPFSVERSLIKLLSPDVDLIFSAEKACYPHIEKKILYPENPSPWKYVNGGGWGGKISGFIKMYETTPPTVELNDQVYLTDRFLDQTVKIKLDYKSSIFQTIAFSNPDEFKVLSGRDRKFVINIMFQTTPAFIHGNGHTPINQFLDND